MSESVAVGISTIYGFIPSSELRESSYHHVYMLLGYRGVVRKDTAKLRLTFSEGGTQLYQKTVAVQRTSVAEKRTLTIVEADYGSTPLVPSKHKSIIFDEGSWSEISGQPTVQQVNGSVEISVSNVNTSNYLVLKIEWVGRQFDVYAIMTVDYNFAQGRITRTSQMIDLTQYPSIYILLPWEPDHSIKVLISPTDPTKSISTTVIDTRLYDTGQSKDTYTSVDVMVEYLDASDNVIAQGSATANLYLAILKKVQSQVTQASIIGIVG